MSGGEAASFLSCVKKDCWKRQSSTVAHCFPMFAGMGKTFGSRHVETVSVFLIRVACRIRWFVDPSKGFRRRTLNCKFFQPDQVRFWLLALSETILAARELGDISENAEFHAAKERQSFLEGRIKYLEQSIGQSEVIDPANLSGTRVVFGATVTVEDLASGESSRYQIVGKDEADVKDGKISITSPLARGLLGHTTDDEVTVKAPGGDRTYEIVDVSFG